MNISPIPVPRNSCCVVNCSIHIIIQLVTEKNLKTKLFAYEYVDVARAQYIGKHYAVSSCVRFYFSKRKL